MLRSYSKRYKSILSIIRQTYNLYFARKKKWVRAITNVTGCTPNNLRLYELAFTPSSFNNDRQENYERLEFLGDSILGAIVSDYLFDLYPNRREGSLTALRSKIVNRNHLNKVGYELGLMDFIRTNKKSALSKDVLGNALESLVGAVYVDHGFRKTRAFILKKMLTSVVDIEEVDRTRMNFKSELLEWAQKNDHEISFDLIHEESENGRMIFTMSCNLNNNQLAVTSDYSKKKAEQRLAQIVLDEHISTD